MVMHYVFLGNPGTGKSTLINCLIQRHACESGLSWGRGVTKAYQRCVDGDDVYMDTPGLADVHLQQQAAAAITQALQEGGEYKLFFMVRVYNGRVVSEDVQTIEYVLKAISASAPSLAYSVLINQVDTRQYARLQRGGIEFQQVLAAVSAGGFSTHHVCMIPVISELDCRTNAIVRLPSDLVEFIHEKAPTMTIARNTVSTLHVDAAALRAECVRLKRTVDELYTDNEKLAKRIGEIKEENENDGEAIMIGVGVVAALLFCCIS